MRKKGVYVLSIACADAWPGLMDGCHAVKSYSKHWPCLFPQHGPGAKHTRAIVLEPWQREVVDEFPEELI